NSLAAGESMICTKQAIITESTNNTAIVTAISEETNETVNATDIEYVEVEKCTPGISISKSSNVSKVPEGEGGYVTYIYNVTNTGTCNLTNITVMDDKLGLICNITAILAPNQSLICVRDNVYINTNTTNIAIVTADVVGGGKVNATDSANVSVISMCPRIAIEKTASSVYVVNGSTVTYYYKVTNIGLVNLTNVVVIDDQNPNDICTIPLLSPDESAICNWTTTLNVTTTNIGCAGSAEGAGACDNVTVYVVSSLCTPGISISKSANTTQLQPGGGYVTYTYNITNTGTCNLTNITLTDDKIGLINCSSTSLAYGQSMICTATAYITSSTDNVATVLASSPVGNIQNISNTVHVEVSQEKELYISKSSNTSTAKYGDIVEFYITVINVGNETMQFVKIVDELPECFETTDSTSWRIYSFAPSTSRTLNITAKVVCNPDNNITVTNKAYAIAYLSNGSRITRNTSFDVIIVPNDEILCTGCCCLCREPAVLSVIKTIVSPN
ncbi:MAG: hypothetical protein ACK4YO_03450, partial [Candidatus Altarchaeaceae archaeon]